MGKEANTSVELRASDRVLPMPDSDSAEYWEGLARGELRLQRCTACGIAQFYPRSLCATCGGSVEWFAATGKGTVHTFTVVRTHGAEPFRSLVPFTLAIVELEEGPRMMTNLTGIDPDDVRIDLPVELEPVSAGDITLPFFTPRADS
ncbi:Zn-ribbon domain-containing OB-fold protein [Microcella sp.]|uniref:Zn-ribbon domain-containing OB-fold protein n=1 Tax=Microcella sp. TaxID=1913979 RepID=UPI00256729CB|nr:Zn-ribbon domain-containing OB-fold protein [Microcella sp.]MBX9472371.1 Zn-ribbon domain-containing OB-fold protein [Microcella sp.]